MAIRILSIYLVIFMVVFSSIQSTLLSDEDILENDSLLNIADAPSTMMKRFNFILFLCQRQEQYQSNLKRKLCSNYIQSNKIQEQEDVDDNEGQQRKKRVGWTISV